MRRQQAGGCDPRKKTRDSFWVGAWVRMIRAGRDTRRDPVLCHYLDTTLFRAIFGLISKIRHSFGYQFIPETSFAEWLLARVVKRRR